MRIACPHCGAQLKANQEHAGKQIQCPKCKQAFRVPEAESLLPPEIKVTKPAALPESAAPAFPANAPSFPAFKEQQAPARVAPQVRRTRYPFMLLASRIYRVLGWVMLIAGGFGVAIYLLVVVIGIIASLGRSGSFLAAILAAMASLAPAAIAVFYVAFMVIGCWFVSEAILWMIDMEDNTNRTSELLTRLCDRE
jgi:predicted Zn finger-like uncharacterized protein